MANWCAYFTFSRIQYLYHSIDTLLHSAVNNIQPNYEIENQPLQGRNVLNTAKISIFNTGVPIQPLSLARSWPVGEHPGGAFYRKLESAYIFRN